MRTRLLIGFCVLYACTPSANNPSREVAAPSLPSSGGGNSNPDPTPTATPEPTDSPAPENPGSGDSEIVLKDCNRDVPGSAHALTVQKDETSGQYKIAFANAQDSALQVISLYVTGKDDGIPIFPKFEFNGAAYWMVSVDDPFGDFFPLPVSYGSLPDKGVDVTVRYKGLANGAKLATLTEPTCLKISVITFEPEEVESFKTSAFWLAHRP